MKRNLVLVAAALFLAIVVAMWLASCSSSKNGRHGSGGGDDDNDDSAFPNWPGNVFSLQYRNSTGEAITVWLEGSQPPCSQAQALSCDSKPGGAPWLPQNYTQQWAALNSQGVFAASGTKFYKINSSRQPTEIDVSNRIDLAPGEILRVIPPLVGGQPQWYWAENGALVTAGVSAWATKTGIVMPASQQTLLFEYNLAPAGLWWDLSAVNGLNANAVMNYEGPGCGSDRNCGCDSNVPKQCRTNLAAYNPTNDGCPYVMQFDSANTCPNPKFYNSIDDSVAKPAWVVPTSAFTTADVSNDYPTIWQTAGSPTGAEMAAAASGSATVKPAYHIWWSTNPVAQGWLPYLQRNSAGKCDAYGWAYDEKRWKPGDSFDVNGNPPDNTDVAALVNCPYLSNMYVNIDILSVM